MDRTTIEALAELARLRLDEAEIARAARQLGRLLEHFATLAAIPTGAVEASPYPLPLVLRTRPDEVGAVLDRAALLANAPVARAGAFQVPRVVDA
jgi:aspartyl-tRNA(Asn)/glutamyl-tRNA(Gln) amidotransferase subunit C